ncbi:hypothetical protein BRADI_1g60902v3 [Brachypodium distachyon]|uniref:Uncharacterized protein n=1 Tax=Brachypodium distachyon TaxID=15368 RepID=A0A2K2DSQ1_BRADI|nr:hypothetical protein BRADI_1g60902v3 [Brachypodium distachyon]
MRAPPTSPPEAQIGVLPIDLGVGGAPLPIDLELTVLLFSGSTSSPPLLPLLPIASSTAYNAAIALGRRAAAPHPRSTMLLCRRRFTSPVDRRCLRPAHFPAAHAGLGPAPRAASPHRASALAPTRRGRPRPPAAPPPPSTPTLSLSSISRAAAATSPSTSHAPTSALAAAPPSRVGGRCHCAPGRTSRPSPTMPRAARLHLAVAAHLPPRLLSLPHPRSPPLRSCCCFAAPLRAHLAPRPCRAIPSRRAAPQHGDTPRLSPTGGAPSPLGDAGAIVGKN